MTDRTEDALELLDADHNAVRKLFQAYRELAANDASEARRKALAEQICMELTIHAKLEEELFYPPVRDAIRDDDLLDEAEVEHAAARDLIVQILSMDPHEELYDAKVTVLGEYIDHHVKEERDEIFPKVRKSGLDLVRLGERLRVRRRELEAVPEALREELLVSLAA
ncbi:MAG TPA: hemerythrin domain-containing protein [Ramlibacter sp.]|jgi:hemerythrin superfamily protein|uniref:hemerythrin domain-containing protein n=1 Tax=Ramlibacter sp. TaxID=1917967 RepID=UPI002D6B9047|nr:hemerythrin domain-containing protein [Ramlibacter sp.]HZY20429.1 hemerythrin domain-containing protein [Ramlibacter sp.]